MLKTYSNAFVMQPGPQPSVCKKRYTPRASGSGINNVPEDFHLWPLFSSLLANPVAGTTSCDVVVEQIFTALFYNYLWTTDWEASITDWLGKALTHTIRHTPHRKFKASLPLLSLACNPSVMHECLCAELLFSLFYLYDDILDQKRSRYQRQTAFDAFGPEENLHSWQNAHRFNMPAAQILLADEEHRDLWQHSLAQIEASEELPVSPQEISFEDYAQQSIKRLGFLGDWWKLAANTAHDTELKWVIEDMYPTSALIGQIRNDLRNTSIREVADGGIQFSDFTDGRATVVTILVRERASGKDRNWIEHNVWNRHKALSPDEVNKLYFICQDLSVLDDLATLAYGYSRDIETAINRSDLPADVKTIWRGWIFRQHRTGVVSPTLATDLEARRFIEAAQHLSAHAQEMPSPYSLMASLL